MMGRRIILSMLMGFSFTVRSSFSFSSGAGFCPAGIAAVSGLHRSSASVSESSMEGSFVVTAGDTTLRAGGTIDLPVGTTLPLMVQSSTSDPFKGILIRLEAPAGVNTETVMDAGSNTQESSVCVAPAVGITHTINSVKLKASGVLRFDAPVSGVQLDITVVRENSAISSVFFYSRYTVNFRDNNPAPTPTAIAYDGNRPTVASMPIVLPPAWPQALRPPSHPYPQVSKSSKRKKGHKQGKRKDKNHKKKTKQRRYTPLSMSSPNRRGINLPGLFRKGFN